MTARSRSSVVRTVHAALIAAVLLAPVSASLAGPGKGGGKGGKAPAPSATASAAPANPAKEHFDSAQALFDDKKFEAALVLFRQAYSETKSPNARVMIGQCLLSLGRTAEAYEELSAAMREAATRAETEPKYADTRDGAAAEVARLENKVGKVVLTFADGTKGGRVTMNGVEVAASRLGAPIAVMPGKLEIVVEGPSAVVRSESVAAAETKTIVLGQITAPGPSGTATSTAPAATAVVPVETTGGGVRKAGYAVAGLGVAGMALFAVGALMADDKLAQLKKECGGVRCTDPKYADVVDSGKTFDLLANIGLGVGAAGLVGGAAMIIFGGPKAVEKAPAALIHVSPQGAMMGVKGSF